MGMLSRWQDRRLVRRIRADIDAPHRQPELSAVGWVVDPVDRTMTLQWVDELA